MNTLAILLVAATGLVYTPPNEERLREIAETLPAKSALCDPAVLAPHKADEPSVSKAKAIAKQAIEPFNAALYHEFVENGNRTHYQNWRNRFVERVDVLVAAEKAERKGRFIPAIAARIDAICTWPSWVLPAHDRQRDIVEGREMRIDLVSSWTARWLAGIMLTLGDALPAETVKRARAEIERRVFRPYLDAPEKHWWYLGKNNWNSVCHAGCVIAALELIDDPAVRARFIDGAERGSAVYLKYGFEPDGYCSEGMGYWNYGFGNFLDLGVAVRTATGGKVDLFKDPQAKRAMRYAAAYQLLDGVAPRFADGGGNSSKAVVARGLGVWPDLRAEYEGKLPIRSAFPKGQVWVSRMAPDDATKFALAFKGGHNAEHHNHNDVGSYCLYLGDKIIAGDVGGEVYTARTFSGHRYESPVLNSYGHPVPRVDGKLQPTGVKYAAKVVKTEFADERDTVVLDLRGAYDCKKLAKLERTFVFDRAAKTVTITDEVAFTEPTEFESPYMTITPGQLKGHVALTATGGEWKQVEEALENPGRPIPHRVAVRFTQPITSAAVSFVYSANIK